MVHKLAMIICQSPNEPHAYDLLLDDQIIRRISKQEMKLPLQLSVPLHTYTGPKKPDMIASFGYGPDTPDQLETVASVSVNQAISLDFQFFQNVALSEKPMEYGGFMTKMAREKSQTIQPGSVINMNPSAHSTIKRAMIGKRLSNASRHTWSAWHFSPVSVQPVSDLTTMGG